jgi:DNA repair exonuclease SbcCD ATPase subunit
MKLLCLRLAEFKGIRSFELTTDGDDCLIRGENASGKSSLLDAFCWLLWGKDSLDQANFEIKRLEPDGTPVSGLDHEVEAELELADGRRMTLKKVLREKWVKRRGSAQRQFQGHCVDHFVDGVPCKQLEYDATVAEIADRNTWRLLTDPAHFSERLHWQERRQLLLEVCGDVPDSDVIASKRELAPLVDVLGRRSIEDHRKVVDARRKEINRELDRLPTRIDEVERGRPDIEGLDGDALVGELASLRERREEAAEHRASLRAGGAVAERTKELREAEAEVQQIETRARTIRDELVGELRRKATAATEARENAGLRIERLDREIREADAVVEMTEREMEALRKEWHTADAQAFEEHESETSCPTCGQDLPQEVVDQAHQKALESFNERKARRLAEISTRGRERKAKRDERAAAAQALRRELETIQGEITKLQEAEDAARQAHQREAEKVDPWRNTEAWQKADRRRAALEEEIHSLQSQDSPDLEAADASLAELDRQVAAAEWKLARLEGARKADARVEELKGEEERLGAEFERLENEVWMLEEFVRSKVSLLEERINSRFEMARFRLFKTLVNGGLEECCDVSYQGVPWASLNHGARINIGLDVIRTLQQHFGVAPCCWIDSAESVVRTIDMPCQTIKLVVDGSAKKLQVQVVERETEKTAAQASL